MGVRGNGVTLHVKITSPSPPFSERQYFTQSVWLMPQKALSFAVIRNGICLHNGECLDLFYAAAQAAVLREMELADLGTVVAWAAEPLLRGAFHPSILFGENRMLLDRNQEEITM